MAANMFSQAEMADERNYYKPQSGSHGAHVSGAARDWSAGMAVYDISKPDAPRQIGFMGVEGAGLHRIWYVGGRWAYASAMIDGFSDYILVIIDMANPTKPEIVGRYWLPGMNFSRPARRRNGHSNAAATACTTRSSPTTSPIAPGATGASRASTCPTRRTPSSSSIASGRRRSGAARTIACRWPTGICSIVLDEAVLDNMEDGFKPIWVFDNQVKSNPISVATFPLPNDRDYVAVGGHFGPHNIHENRPGSFQSSGLIFATYQNAGVRVYDIADPMRPVDSAPVPPAPKKLVDPRPNRPIVLHSADVFVDKNGLCYCTDWSGAGLSIMEYLG